MNLGRLAMAILVLGAGCMVSTVHGAPHTPMPGQVYQCHVQRYCGAVGGEDLGYERACSDNDHSLELQNRMAYECWDAAAGCSGGFCEATCEPVEGQFCLMTPEED